MRIRLVLALDIQGTAAGTVMVEESVAQATLENRQLSRDFRYRQAGADMALGIGEPVCGPVRAQHAGLGQRVDVPAVGLHLAGAAPNLKPLAMK